MMKVSPLEQELTCSICRFPISKEEAAVYLTPVPGMEPLPPRHSAEKCQALLVAEIESLRNERDVLLAVPYCGEVAALRDVLERLVDYQNGCPLPSDEAHWTKAMSDARRLLKGTPPHPVAAKPAPPEDRPSFELIRRVCEGRGSLQEGYRVSDYLRFLEGELYANEPSAGCV